jgi:hypothetical protein
LYSGINVIGRIDGLTGLVVNLVGGEMRGLQFLETIKGLTNLTIISTGSNISNLDALMKLRNLNVVEIICRRIEEPDYPMDPGHIANADALNRLVGVKHMRIDLEGSKEEDFESFNKLKLITKLRIDNEKFGGTDLGSLKGMARLVTLELVDLMGEYDLEALDGLKGLKSLRLEIGDEDFSIEQLKQLKGLTSLSLSDQEGGTFDLSPLTELDKLTDLQIESTRQLVLSAWPKSMTSLDLRLNIKE